MYEVFLQVVVWVDPLDGTQEFTNGMFYRENVNDRDIPIVNSLYCSIRVHRPCDSADRDISEG